MAESLIADFYLQCKELSEAGLKAISEELWSSGSSIFHRLSGSAYAIRTLPLAVAAGDLEKLLNQFSGDFDSLNARVHVFEQELQRFEIYVRQQGW